MTPAARIAERLRALADEVLDIRALSRVRPDRFLEDKSEVAGALRALAKDLDETRPALPPPRPAFATGTIADRKGRPVTVERRRSAA